MQYGYELRMPYEVGAYARVCDPLRAVGGEPAPEIGVMRIGVPEVREAASNTLVLYLGERRDEAAAAARRAGLARCRREDAGLLVVLFRQGVPGRGDRALQGRLRELGESFPAPMMANEDVREAWARLLALPAPSDEPSWRLMAPDGTVRWSHEGRDDAELVAVVLDERLVSSAPAGPGRLGTDLDLGSHVPIALATRHCPPVSLACAGSGGSTLVFVVEGASVEEADALRKRWQLDMPVFPDQGGALTRAAGVRFSPSTLTLDDGGRLVGYAPGIDLGPYRPVPPRGGTGSGEAP